MIPQCLTFSSLGVYKTAFFGTESDGIAQLRTGNRIVWTESERVTFPCRFRPVSSHRVNIVFIAFYSNENCVYMHRSSFHPVTFPNSIPLCFKLIVAITYDRARSTWVDGYVNSWHFRYPISFISTYINIYINIHNFNYGVRVATCCCRSFELKGVYT